MARRGVDDSFLERAVRFAARAVSQGGAWVTATVTEAQTPSVPGFDATAFVVVGKNDERILLVLEQIVQQQVLTNLYLAQIIGHKFNEGDR